MVPPSIKRNLSGLRTRERALSLIWGVACVVSIGLFLLMVACFTDWLIDRFRDTPLGVRISLLLFQLGTATLGVLFFVLWPQLRRLSDSTLALWVEEKMPNFRHRLISAVQLNQPGAELGGMSKELITVVTREAEKQAAKVSFAQIADHTRLIFSAVVVIPVVLIALVPLAIWPTLVLTLLARQTLWSLEMPRSVQLESINESGVPLTKDGVPVWPSGEDIVISYLVTGEWTKDMVGTVFVTPNDDSTARYPLTFHKEHERGAIFRAAVNPAQVDLTHTARIADGRTRHASTLMIVSRPIVNGYEGWVQIPEYCGKRPDGTRYEVQHKNSDLSGIPGSAARLKITASKPITEATLELRGQAVREIILEDYRPTTWPSDPQRPLRITSFEDFAAEVGEAAVPAMQARVHFEKEHLILFAWSGKVETLVPRFDKALNEVVFHHIVTREDEKADNVRLFVVPRNARLKISAGAPADGEAALPETPREEQRRKMKISSDGLSAELTFDLVPGLSAYRVFVKDEYGFDNGTPPRRTLALVPEPPPDVKLLRDSFFTGGESEIDLEGLPVVLGSRIRIPYRVDAQFGMSEARVFYRVLKKHESGNDPVEEEKWVRLPVRKELSVDPNPRVRKLIDALDGLIEEQTKVNEKTKAAEPNGPQLEEAQLTLFERAEALKKEIEPLVQRHPEKAEIETALNGAAVATFASAPLLNAKAFTDAGKQQADAVKALRTVRNNLKDALYQFDQRTGVFVCTPFDEEIPFHAVPSSDPKQKFGRTLGGGRIFVETKGILGSKGVVQLKSGDQIEYFVEVLAMKRDGHPTPVGRSETRVVTLMDSTAFTAWLQNVAREEDRVRLLEARQKGVFDPK